MKNLTLFLVMISAFAFGQETEYKISKDGFTDFVVIQTPDKSAAELYTKTLEWINKTYKNPERVILGKVENDYIRFEGFAKSLYCYNPIGLAVCDDVRYQIEVSAKDGKYKFDVIQMESYMKPSQSSAGGWFPLIAGNNASFFYKKDGSIKGGWKNYLNAIPDYFNNLNKDLNTYISTGSKTVDKTDW